MNKKSESYQRTKTRIRLKEFGTILAENKNNHILTQLLAISSQ